MNKYLAESDFSTAVLVPPVVVHHLDPHTGIPFLPHIAAHLAGSLRYEGFQVQVLDAFGLQPNYRQKYKNLMLIGLSEEELVENLHESVRICFIYCRTMVEFLAVERLAKEIRRRRPNIKICLFENIQAVTSFSLEKVAGDFLGSGTVDTIILGEPESRAKIVVEAVVGNRSLEDVNGIIYMDSNGVTTKTGPHAFDQIEKSKYFPAWDIHTLDGYWNAGFAHAPCETNKFLPILTSRGCPYKCTFCITPFLNPKWRARNPEDVVDEMEFMYTKMGVTEFHISDLNPTVNDKRTQEICRELIRRKLPIIWKVAQGTKIETIKSEETLELMAKAGCKFLAFSPESGSSRLLKIVKKPFNHVHGLKMAKAMHKLGVPLQACFIAGLPEETRDDQIKTLKYMWKLVIAGVDEVSCYIFTPVPGAELSGAFEGYEHYSQCTPSPNWRKDYKSVLKFRFEMYLSYFALKILFHPINSIRSAAGIFTGKYRTKMEMSIFKQLKFYVLWFFPYLLPKSDYRSQLLRVDPKFYDGNPLKLSSAEPVLQSKKDVTLGTF